MFPLGLSSPRTIPTTAEFDAQEKLLLDRLDSLQAKEKLEPAPVKKSAKPPSKARRPGKKHLAKGKSAALT